MVDMKKEKLIEVWEGCDASVARAIDQLRACWKPYSTSSRRFPIIRLIEELIDPAFAEYMKGLPSSYLNFVSGAGAGAGASFSEMIRLVGFDAMVRVQRELLRRFLKTMDDKRTRDRRFVATLESLIDCVWCCACKQPVKSKLRDTQLNGHRRNGFCKFCGNFAELTSFKQGHDDTKADDPDDKLRLSSNYCSDHRPKLQSGAWNPAYRAAKRSQKQFDLELVRLSRQSAALATPRARSGDPMVDAYIFEYVAFQTLLQPADKRELRNLARLMVDWKLSDRKKKMLIMLKDGHNHSQIAQELKIERQAVFKALKSIPKKFCLDKKRKRTCLLKTQGTELQLSILLT
jgi:DNA-binding CsgD family transcriptional regulator